MNMRSAGQTVAALISSVLDFPNDIVSMVAS